MLCELFIENLAVIQKTDILFEKGLNVFTGETGAGKSIVIDAINAVLGQRTSKEIVRHGETKASITARFRNLNKKALQKLDELGFATEDGELILSREIFADAKSTARVMGRPVTVSVLKEIGAELIAIHGQHDNQVLLSPERHMEILDQYGDFARLQEEYLGCYKAVVRIKREMKQAALGEQEKSARMDLLQFQCDEIEAAALQAGEEDELTVKREEMRNAARIIEQLATAYGAVYGVEGEGGALERAQLASSAVEKAAEFYSNGEALFSAAVSVSDALADLSDMLRDALESVHYDEPLLTEIEERISLIHQLKRKYGGDEDEINAYAKQAREELDALSLSEERLLALNEQGQTEYARLLKLAEKLTECRRKAADRFVKSVTGELIFLDMPSVKLVVSLSHVKPNSKGQGGLEFLISTNPGEPPKPISKIASGGELSRIMLAIKNTLADKDEIQTLIFDEIDTGVSGRAAQKIGLKLSQAAKDRQILSVTHLAQIAALSDHHYLIEKASDGNRTFTKVQKLTIEGRIEEVARIMSTDEITDLMRQNAREMIEKRV